MHSADDNPLLDFAGLPRFDRIRAHHVLPAVDALLSDARAAVERAARDTRPATWDTVVAPTEAAFDHLDRAWGAVRHLNAVVNTPAIRDAYNAALPKVTAFYADIAQDPRSFARFRELEIWPKNGGRDARVPRFKARRAPPSFS